jgi:hypothetical protein
MCCKDASNLLYTHNAHICMQSAYSTCTVKFIRDMNISNAID